MSADSAPASGQQAEGPRCYRHPNRETYVSCTRCERPICPDCMREAPVGHQCPECVAEANRGVRQPRTVFGGRATASDTPVLTYILIAINAVVYLAELASKEVVSDLGMIGQVAIGPYHLTGVGVAEGEWYRLITSAFVHQTPSESSFGIFHILFNMWILWALGPTLEQTLGRLRFGGLYFLSALGGSVLVYLVSPNSLTIGASGAIFGLFAAFFILSRKLGRETGGIVTLLALNLVITFAVPNISWEGHVGGLVTGGVVAAAFAYAPAQRRTLVQVIAATGITAILLVLVMVQTANLTA